MTQHPFRLVAFDSDGTLVDSQHAIVAAMTESWRGMPHPEMLEHAMVETGTLPEKAVFIGDTSFDMLMARNTGTAAVGAGWGYHAPDELIGAGADAIAEAPGILPILLGALERTA